MTRRNFCVAAAASPLGVLGPRALAAQDATRMKVTSIDTIYWKSQQAAPWWPHWIWVRVHTDSGLDGIGETYPRNEVEAAMVHSVAARMLAGRDPRDIDRIWADFYRTFDYQISGGTEMRVLSAINLALWDLLGKSLHTPVYRLIGGKSNPRVRLYNTCFPYKYDFNKEPEKIMRELIETRGIHAIKIWPFDGAAARNQHQFITPADIEEALAPVRKLRDAFGEKIEILMEFHSNWNLTSAIRIARALEPYKPMWLEDMLLPGNFEQYRQLAEATALPLTISERMAGRMEFLRMLEARAAKYVMFDVCWCGGLSEARKIATMAEAFQLPVAPHTAGGPLLFYASTHLSTASTNLWIQESCQRFYERDWPKMLIDPIAPKDGYIEVPELPGFGMEIKPEVWEHPAAVRQTTKL
ncbi:MAG TPA: mandelate racemase/muconate lactonizing enzyme family protein [Bryobacterales bacterium]|nr:mandelate racemase/muconate lactonizing enzyme family protein [Bryobacterales bacterium]